jgi:hypothetical protein
MANISKAERERRAADQSDAESVDDGLIEMTDGSLTLRLHPDCVTEHQKLGWKISE